MEDAETGPISLEVPRTPSAPKLSEEQVEALGARIDKSLEVLTDGRWEPSKDIPAGVKLVMYVCASLAFGAHGITELLALFQKVAG